MVDLEPIALPPAMPLRLPEILMDNGLAKLGDAYINLLYSYTLGCISGTPTGKRVSDQTLFHVAWATGLRQLLPRRTPKGRVADAVESLLAYAWLRGVISFEKMVSVSVDGAKGFEDTLTVIVNKVLKSFEA